MLIATLPFIFLLGLITGSFFNVVGLRVPKGESIISPPSHCPNCQKQLTPIELIPVISYLLSKGRCRGCGQRISPLYPVMEGLTGSFYVLVVWQYGLTWEAVGGLLLVSLLVMITVSDLAYQLIPNRVLLFFFPLFLLMRIVQPYPGTSIWQHLISMVAGFLFFLLIAIISRGGMGGGDIKLLGVIGLFLPLSLLIVTIFLSSFFGALYGLGLVIVRRAGKGSAIPFGPFIALGAVVAYLYGAELLNWYFSFY